MGGSSSNSICWVSSSLLGQLASAGVQQQRQQNTGKGRAVALGLVLGGSAAGLGTVQVLGRADVGQPGIPKVPFRHAGHLSWGCVSQHSWSLPSTLCSEVVAPGTWGCVFSLVLVEALLSVWLVLWGWSLARGPLLSDSPLCSFLWCRVLSFLCCLFPSFQALQGFLLLPFLWVSWRRMSLVKPM